MQNAGKNVSLSVCHFVILSFNPSDPFFLNCIDYYDLISYILLYIFFFLKIYINDKMTK